MSNHHLPRLRPLALSLLLACGAGASLPAMAGATCDLYDGDPATEDNGGASTGTQDDRTTACGVGAAATGVVSTAFGGNAQATGGRSVAVGHDAQAANSATIAIGNRAVASGAWSLALGEDATTTEWGALAFGVGSSATGQFSSATGVYSEATGQNSLALGGFLGTSTTNVDPYRFTQATAARAIAVGNAAQAHAEEAVALGVKTRVLAGADRAVAIGSDSIASEADTVSFGHLATNLDFSGTPFGSDLQRRLINVADGVDAHDAATVGQLGSFVGALGGGAGFGGGVFTAPSYTIQGASYGDVGAAFAAVDMQLSSLQGSIDAIPADPPGPGSATAVEYDGTAAATITLEGADGTVVSNVADGVAAQDAVNRRQLDASTAGAVASSRVYTDSVFAQFDAELDSFRGEVDRRFRVQDERIDQIAAMGGAYAGMAMNTAGLAGRNRVGVGVGSQNGESAMAIGYQRVIGERASVSFGAAFGGGESSVMGGAGFSW